MAETTAGRRVADAAPKAAFLYRPEVRQVIYQILLVAALVAGFWYIIHNTIINLRRLGIASGFGFWDKLAGFDIAQTLIPYSAMSNYGQAFWVGFWNTVAVSALGIVFATIIGFVVGIARLSNNWLIARLDTIFVEALRNIPLLLLLFFWYYAVLQALPQARNAMSLPGGAYLSNRGLLLPSPVAEHALMYFLGAIALAIALSIGIGAWAHKRRLVTGKQFPVFLTTVGLLAVLPAIAVLVAGPPVSFEYPVKGAFNFTGGLAITPEYLSLLFGLSFYTASFIAETVRAGILAVTKGQKEAAAALGLHPGQSMRLVVLPQALRVMIPPMTSSYLSLTKNSSLGLAIGYPDLVSVTGTMLNQTGQAVEIILLTMAVYLSLSLLTSLFMNWFNARIALVER